MLWAQVLGTQHENPPFLLRNGHSSWQLHTALINNKNGETNSLSLNYVEGRWQGKRKAQMTTPVRFQTGTPAPIHRGAAGQSGRGAQLCTPPWAKDPPW